MKIAFCTCVQIGLSCIEAVLEIGGKFDLFLTLNDHKAKNKSGRVYLDELSKTSSTPLIKINHINDQQVLDAIQDYDIDWLFIIGWSQIASKEVIENPNLGVIGAHPTLLPKGRGRAAIPWAILKKEEKTGVTFFKMDEGVDTGDILGQFEILLTDNTNATDLYFDVNQAHVSLIKLLWPSLVQNSLVSKKQNNKDATYWEGRKPADGEIHSHMTMDEVDCLVRATTKPYPGAYFIDDDGSKIIIWQGEISSTSREKESNIRCLKLIDGWFVATNFEIHFVESN